MPKTYPDTTFADKARERGAIVKLMWEMRGPPNTGIAFLSCYAVNDGVVIVSTFKNGNGWTVLTEGRKSGIDETVVEAMERCGTKL